MILSRDLTLVFATAALSLCALHPSSAQDDAASVNPPSLNPLHRLEKTNLKAFIEEPLFDPTRRLPPVAAPIVQRAMPVIAAPPSPPPNVHLLGVIQGDRDVAIVHRDEDSKTILLRSGDHVDDWVVTILPRAGIRLRNGDRVFDYALFSKTGDVPGPVAVENQAAEAQDRTENSHAARLLRRPDPE